MSNQTYDPTMICKTACQSTANFKGLHETKTITGTSKYDGCHPLTGKYVIAKFIEP